ncbi:MAG: DUF3352 domain-containing protein [Acidimicrobiales bacterium]
MRRFAALVLCASLVVLPACGKKTDEAARAAGITPRTALAMFSVNLSPSIEQKRNLLSIAKRFPEASDQVKGEFESTRDEVLQEILEPAGLDYDKDVKPWLGKEAAAVILPPGDADGPLFLAMVQTEDKAKAEAAIAKATKAGDFEGAYAVVDNFVVISDQDDPADNQPALDQIVAQAKKDDGGLAKDASFTKVVNELAGDRLLLGWVDSAASLDVAEQLGGLEDAGFLKSFGKDAIAFDVHVEPKAVVFQGVAVASGGGPGSAVELTKTLPATTLAAFTMFKLGDTLTKAIKDAGGAGGEDIAGQFEEATGLDLQDDILSWMQGETVISVGSPRGGQQFPDFALVVEPTDKAKAAAAITKIRDSLTEQGIELEEQEIGGSTAYVVPEAFAPGIQPAMALFPDRFVLANSPAYLGDLAKASTPSLGSSETYTNLLGKDDKATTAQFILLIDPIREAIEKALIGQSGADGSYEDEVKPNLEPLAAFGVKAHRDGDFNKVEVKLTLD